MTEKLFWPYELEIIRFGKPDPSVPRVEPKYQDKHATRAIFKGPDEFGVIVNPLLEAETRAFLFHPSDFDSVEDERNEAVVVDLQASDSDSVISGDVEVEMTCSDSDSDEVEILFSDDEDEFVDVESVEEEEEMETGDGEE
jgi:hypothetical protein